MRRRTHDKQSKCLRFEVHSLIGDDDQDVGHLKTLKHLLIEKCQPTQDFVERAMLLILKQAWSERNTRDKQSKG